MLLVTHQVNNNPHSAFLVHMQNPGCMPSTFLFDFFFLKKKKEQKIKCNWINFDRLQISLMQWGKNWKIHNNFHMQEIVACYGYGRIALNFISFEYLFISIALNKSHKFDSLRQHHFNFYHSPSFFFHFFPSFILIRLLALFPFSVGLYSILCVSLYLLYLFINSLSLSFCLVS